MKFTRKNIFSLQFDSRLSYKLALEKNYSEKCRAAAFLIFKRLTMKNGTTEQVHTTLGLGIRKIHAQNLHNRSRPLNVIMRETDRHRRNAERST